MAALYLSSYPRLVLSCSSPDTATTNAATPHKQKKLPAILLTNANIYLDNVLSNIIA
jgi:hypothetical protein